MRDKAICLSEVRELEMHSVSCDALYAIMPDGRCCDMTPNPKLFRTLLRAANNPKAPAYMSVITRDMSFVMIRRIGGEVTNGI